MLLPHDIWAPPMPTTLVDACGRNPVRRALEVVVLSPDIRAWLLENDPQALRQALSALGFKLCVDCRAVIRVPVLAQGARRRVHAGGQEDGIVTTSRRTLTHEELVKRRIILRESVPAVGTDVATDELGDRWQWAEAHQRWIELPAGLEPVAKEEFARERIVFGCSKAELEEEAAGEHERCDRCGDEEDSE